MDPFLEDPAGWPNFHFDLIAEIKGELNRLLRPKYYARAEERVYVSDQDDPGRRVIVPDMRVLARDHGPEQPSPSPSATAHPTVAEPVEVVTLIEDEIREMRIEVIDASLRQVVTVIEVLSPTNKVADACGQRSFRHKRAEVLCSASHWVEIDLLRAGERLVSGELLPYGDYFVHVSRVERRPRGQVWPIQLPQRLPAIPIPLREPDPDAKLDLQELLSNAYDRSSYDLAIDYRREPIPPLSPDYASWADQLLRASGLR
jgi:hypothetical protein